MANFPWKPRHDDGKPDHRYSVRLEWTGKPSQQWVARFCDEWLGAFDFGEFKTAAARCKEHQTKRLA